MFLDTSAVIEHFLGSKRGERVAAILKREPCFISILSLAEAKIWCIKNNRDYAIWLEKTSKMVSIVEITKSICESGAEITHTMQKTNKNFGLMDGLILATARSLNQGLMMKDAHFKGIEDVEII
ncbi:MAG: PIN domain-containing protein [Methanobacteriota archaeon]